MRAARIAQMYLQNGSDEENCAPKNEDSNFRNTTSLSDVPSSIGDISKNFGALGTSQENTKQTISDTAYVKQYEGGISTLGSKKKLLNSKTTKPKNEFLYENEPEIEKENTTTSNYGKAFVSWNVMYADTNPRKHKIWTNEGRIDIKSKT